MPVILQQPQNLPLDFGNDFTFSVAAYSADGGTLSYQWYYKASENDEAAAINYRGPRPAVSMELFPKIKF